MRSQSRISIRRRPPEQITTRSGWQTAIGADKEAGYMLKESTYAAVDALIARYPALSVCRGDLREAVETICESFRAGRKLITCGNGGSAADAEHIVGELMKGFLLPRPLSAELKEHLQRVCPQEAAYFSENLQGTLPAMSLVNQIALNTAFANDQAPDLCFAQQI